MVDSSLHAAELPSPPQVSVLMAVYNERTDHLATALGSVLEQTLQDLELVLLDDGSDDPNTRATLAQFARQDRRIRLYWEPHRGLTPTLNLGLSRCRAPLVCRHDSDDWSYPTRLAKQVQFLHQHPEVGVAGTFLSLHQEDGTLLWPCRLPATLESVRNAFEERNPFCHGSICFRREAALAVGGYREELKTCQDYDFLWRLCDGFGGANLPEVLYCHRRTASSISSTKTAQQLRDAAVIRSLGRMRRGGVPENIEAARREADTAPPEAAIVSLLKQADQLLLAGHFRPALAANLAAIKRAPATGLAYAKLLRAFLFRLAPRLRPWLFRP